MITVCLGQEMKTGISNSSVKAKIQPRVFPRGGKKSGYLATKATEKALEKFLK